MRFFIFHVPKIADLLSNSGKRIKEDYGNGREYYAFHGKKLAEIPEKAEERPSKQFLLWHNEHVYLA